MFDCRVSGDPVPSITWKKRNQQMPVGRAYIAADNKGLRIDRYCYYYSIPMCLIKLL